MGSPTLTRRAVFLDRDGVLNAQVRRAGADGPPWRLQDLRLLPGVETACARLRAAGRMLIVVTNQPDVARGQLQPAVVAALHAQLYAWLPLTEIVACLHDDGDDCSCRKPRPGMLLEAARRHSIDLAQSWMVGDRCKDIAAGQSAGTRTILVGRAARQSALCNPDLIASSLPEATELLLCAPAVSICPSRPPV